MTFDPTKPVQTRDGRPARILCTDRSRGLRTIVALYGGRGTGEELGEYLADGSKSDIPGDPLDLINVPEKRTVWVNIYAHRIGGPYLSKADADDDYRFATDTRIACVPVTYTVDEALT